ncbi:MAG: hypothetical protein L0099_07185 [Acidobacteria bacterium]|nr:hypothetical protein [Acidobacteriota bacterium]
MDILITAGIYLLEGMFLVGLAGSALVAVITFVQDAQILLSIGSDD